MSRVALVQMVSSTQIKDNLDQVEQLLMQAVAAEADLVVLPENFAYMGMLQSDVLNIAEPYGQGPIQDQISRLAKKFGLWVIAGTIPIKGPGSKVRARCIVYDNNGLTVAYYDKIHLFDVQVSKDESYQESATVEAGSEPVVVDTPVGKIGLTICYDLRFPELYYRLLCKGAQLFTVPSAFTAITGLAHWEVLLRARAIENLAYVLAPNQGGLHQNGRLTYGHSMIIEPWGGIIAQQAEHPGLVIADIDLQRVQQLRQQFPSVDHHVLG